MSTATALPQSTTGHRVPPLEDGDRLTRDEFERRYKAMPKHVKAELIEGVVYMASPAHFKAHDKPDFRLTTWLGVYESSTPGTQGGSNGTVRLGSQDEPQPDVFLFIDPEYGGQVYLSEDDYVENAPELIVEIAASSSSRDLGPKKRAYAQNGVREYIVWRTLENAIDWFILRNGVYVPLAQDASGIIRSETFPGLWLNVPATLLRDSSANLATLREGLESPEHAAFVAELAAKRAARIAESSEAQS